jgi:hypothetical protein
MPEMGRGGEEVTRCFICLSELPEVHGWMTQKRGGEAYPCCPLVEDDVSRTPKCEWDKVFDPVVRAKYEEEKRKDLELQLKVRAKNEGRPEGFYTDTFEAFMEKFRARHPQGWPKTPGKPGEAGMTGNPGKSSTAGNVVSLAVPVAEPVRDFKSAAAGENDEEEWDGREEV